VFCVHFVQQTPALTPRVEPPSWDTSARSISPILRHQLSIPSLSFQFDLCNQNYSKSRTAFLSPKGAPKQRGFPVSDTGITKKHQWNRCKFLERKSQYRFKVHSISGHMKQLLDEVNSYGNLCEHNLCNQHDIKLYGLSSWCVDKHQI
jgi:hypothetical protein